MSGARKIYLFQLVVAATATAACAEPRPAISVTINTPAEGDTIRDTVVTITLGVAGIELAPAADNRPGTAHHHLYLDTDFPALDSPIPAGMPNIVHLGKAQTEYLWSGVQPGAHRVIAVLADPGHVPIKPWVTDTVNFVVAARPDSVVKD